jgi:hypothetical protein
LAVRLCPAEARSEEAEEPERVEGMLGVRGSGGKRAVQSLKCVWNEMHGRTHVGGIEAMICDEYWISGLRYFCITGVVGGIVPVRGDVAPPIGVEPTMGTEPTIGAEPARGVPPATTGWRGTPEVGNAIEYRVGASVAGTNFPSTICNVTTLGWAITYETPPPTGGAAAEIGSFAAIRGAVCCAGSWVEETGGVSDEILVTGPFGANSSVSVSTSVIFTSSTTPLVVALPAVEADGPIYARSVGTAGALWTIRMIRKRDMRNVWVFIGRRRRIVSPLARVDWLCRPLLEWEPLKLFGFSERLGYNR